MGSASKAVAVTLLLTLIISGIDAGEASSDEKRAELHRSVMRKIASQMGWPANIIEGRGRFKDKSFMVTSTGYGRMTEAEGVYIEWVPEGYEDYDRAVISYVGSEKAKNTIDTLAVNGLHRTGYRGHDGVIMRKGEIVCEAGGLTGSILEGLKFSVRMMERILNTDVDESSICAEYYGTVSWRCGDYLFIASSADEDDNSMQIADTIYRNAEDAGLCAGYLDVHGEVTDGNGRPLKNVKVGLDYRKKGGGWREYGVTRSDNRGGFIIYYDPLELGSAGGDVEGMMWVELEDMNKRFRIIYNQDPGNAPYIVESKPFKLPRKTEVNMMLRGDNRELAACRGCGDSVERIWGAGVLYHDTEKVFTFTQNTLGYDFKGGGNTMPLKVYIYVDGESSAYYDPLERGGGVFLPTSRSRHNVYTAPETPMWHEFFHYAMYNKYRSWSHYGTPGDNHGGFKNNNTGDSYEEGFAEFWPNVVSMELDRDTEHLYGDYKNIELNYNPWVNEGIDEDFAVAALFWDLIDRDNDRGDRITISYTALWDVLMDKPLRNMVEVHDALVARWPDKQGEIDSVFISHGFFRDTKEGNGEYDRYEPYWDDDEDGKRDAGEDYVDVGTPDDILLRPHQTYDEGETVGTASNYNRPYRLEKPLTENSYVKVDVLRNGGRITDPVFKVSYSFPDDRDYETIGLVDEETGYVYVEIPPDNQGMTASITVGNYLDSGRITVSSNEYYSPETAERGYIDAGEITVGARKTDYCNGNGVCEPEEGGSCGDCPAGQMGEPQVTGNLRTRKGGGLCCCLPFLTAALAFAAAAVGKTVF